MADLKSHKVTIALGNSVYKNTISQKKISLEQLFKNLSKPIIQNKKDGKYFIFASFSKDIRNAQNVDQYYGATIDLDDTPLSLKEIKSKFKKYIHCIYTTFSHRENKEKGDRYRLVIPYKLPVDANTHVNTIMYLMYLLGIDNVDLSSKALSRPMYLPASHPKRRANFEYYFQKEGFLLNPQSSKIKEKISQLNFENFDNNQGTEQKFDIKEDVVQGDRNNALSSAVGKFIRTGMAVEDLLPMAEAWNASKVTPPLSDKEVKTIVNSIVKAHTRNTKDLEWGYEEIISRIKQSKNIDNDYDHILDMVVTAKTKNKLKPSQLQLIVNKINQKAKVGKRTIQQEITSKELELIGKLEQDAEDSFESASTALKEDFKNWVYVASDDRVYNLSTGEYFKKEAFAAMFANPNIDGSLFQMIMKYNLMKKVSRLEFDPGKDEVYVRDNIRFGNTYIHPEIFPLPGDIKPILRHFRYLIPERYERTILLDFIAHLVQHPGTKIRWMPIIKGGKGIGKTIIAEKIIMPLIGFQNFGKVNNEVIKSDFNAWQLDKQLVVFEELDIGANQKEKEQLTDRLKSFITDNILTAHRKGLDPYDTINKANALGFTNKEDAIIITMDERRFCMIRSDVKPQPDKYYQKLADYADNNLSEIYHFFMERDLSKFSPLRAPETKYTNEIKGLSMGWPGSIINEWRNDPTHPINIAGCAGLRQIVECIKTESIGRYRAYAEDLNNPGSAQSKKLYNTLRGMNFIRYVKTDTADERISINGIRQQIWLLPERVEELQNTSVKKIKKLVDKIKIKDMSWGEG